MNILTLLACQIDIPSMTMAAERDAHLARSAEQIHIALGRKPADLVVLPELSSLEYSRAAFERLDDLAEPLEGPSYRTWAAVARAHGCCVAYGFARRGTRGDHISIAAVGPDGALLGYYDKLHLAQFGASMEKEYFTRGDRIFTFDVKGFCISPIICYDLRIPELSRALTLEHNVDLILHCGAYARDESFATWHGFATTRALENQVFFLSLNRAGRAFGNSVMCWPWMDDDRPPTVFAAHEEEFRYFVLRRAELDAARANYSFLSDRLASYDLDQ